MTETDILKQLYNLPSDPIFMEGVPLLDIEISTKITLEDFENVVNTNSFEHFKNKIDLHNAKYIKTIFENNNCYGIVVSNRVYLFY